MAARVRKIRHDEETRAKIQTSQLINRLENHVLGTVDLKPTQVTAALGLLKKTIPDLSAVNHSGEIELKRAAELSDDELAGIATARSNGTAEASDDTPVLN